MAGTGSSNVTGLESFLYCDNMSFDGTERTGMTTDGQLWIGSTVAPHVRIGTLSAGTGISITPGSGNVTITNTAPGAGTDLHTAKFIVGDTANGANYSTIAAALTEASSGDTIFIQTGTYTENLTLKGGVFLTAFTPDGYSDTPTSTQNVKIIGKMTMTVAGCAKIANIQCQTNGDFILSVTGSNTSEVQFQNCYINCTNNTGVSSTATNGEIRFLNCSGNLGTTGISFFAISGGINLSIMGYGRWANTGSSQTPCTWSAGTLIISNCEFYSYLTSSGTASGFLIYNVFFNAGGSTTVLTHGSTLGVASSMYNCTVTSGTASAISVGAGASMILYDSIIGSSNTNAITGAGAISYGGLIFQSGLSSNINVTTQTVVKEGPSRTIGSTNTGATNTLTVTNTSNTASSAAAIVSNVAGGTAADATYQATITSGQAWTWGLDNSDSDAWVLASSSSLGTTNVMRVATSGEINYPLQPAFLAVGTSTESNVTGDGTFYTLAGFNSEIFDQNSDFASNTFTAPVAGRYRFDLSVSMSGIISTHTQGALAITATSRNFITDTYNPYASSGVVGGIFGPTMSVLLDMAAGDTCVAKALASNGTKVVDIVYNGTADPRTWFSGNLVA